MTDFPVEMERMGSLHPHAPVKLVLGMLAREESLFCAAEAAFQDRFGTIHFTSPMIPFTWTEYYRKEMGEDLYRKFVSFEKLVSPGDLSGIKLFAQEIETKLSDAKSRRRINLDPGYLTEAKLVLASTKDHQHRIWLGDGIFGEVTLRFVKGKYRGWEWTYPDFLSEEYASIFLAIRDIYRKQLNRKAKG